MAKKFVVNAGICDMRNVTEETLTAHEETVVNAATVLVSPRAKELIQKHPVTLNCGETIEMEGNVKISTVNGSAEINSTDTPEDHIFLIVNGSLQIGPNTEEVLKHYAGITVNGAVLCPKSLSGKLGALKVNGSTDFYPDGAVVMKRAQVIDKLFVLRAKPVLYWSRRRMILVDPQLDGKALAQKGVKFSAREAIIAESLVESTVDLFTPETDIQIGPDGTAVVRDDLTLNPAAFRRYGGKLYVLGDLTLEKDSGEILPKLEYLHVAGDVSLPASLEEAFAAVEAEYKELHVIRGKRICDVPVLKLSRWMLEREPEGLTVADCAMVTLGKDIPPELIAEKLVLQDCATVKCTPEQEGAVTLIAQDVAQIDSGDKEKGIGDLLKGALTGEYKTVNAATYVM